MMSRSRPILRSTPRPAQKPTLFEEKKYVPIKELFRKAGKAPSVIPGTGGRMYTRQEQKKILEELLPYKGFGAYLNKDEAKRVLRNLRREEYKNPSRRTEVSRRRRWLEENLGLRGKY